MESTSVRPPGWVMLDSMVRWQYARDCVLSPTRKAEREYWFRIDGSPTGVKATCVERDETGCTYRPDDGTYAATPEIGSFCATTPTPRVHHGRTVNRPASSQSTHRSGCDARASWAAASPTCRRPASQCRRSRIFSAPKGAENTPRMPDAKVAADPGFQRMCRRPIPTSTPAPPAARNMTTYGTGGLGSDGQADAFYQCQKLYQGVLNMCHATRYAAAKAVPAAPAAPPPRQRRRRPRPPPNPGRPTAPAHSTPPPAQPQPPQMSAQCQQLVSNYVGAAQANDGARALAGYDALKSAGGCDVLDKVDSRPPPTATAGDPRFPTRRATPLTDSYVQPCNADEARCAQAMRQLEGATLARGRVGADHARDQHRTAARRSRGQRPGGGHAAARRRGRRRRRPT